MDVFEVVECGIGWRFPPDAVMEGDLVVRVTFIKFKEGVMQSIVDDGGYCHFLFLLFDVCFLERGVRSSCVLYYV